MIVEMNRHFNGIAEFTSTNHAIVLYDGVMSSYMTQQIEQIFHYFTAKALVGFSSHTNMICKYMISQITFVPTMVTTDQTIPKL